MGSAPFNASAKSFRSIEDNLSETASLYDYKDGYFGTKSDYPSHPEVNRREIVSEDKYKTAENFYNKISAGGYEKKRIKSIVNEGGKPFERVLAISVMADGTVITYRNYSSSDNSPVVEFSSINDSHDTGGIKKQKILFVEKK